MQCSCQVRNKVCHGHVRVPSSIIEFAQKSAHSFVRSRPAGAPCAGRTPRGFRYSRTHARSALPALTPSRYAFSLFVMEHLSFSSTTVPSVQKSKAHKLATHTRRAGHTPRGRHSHVRTLAVFEADAFSLPPTPPSTSRSVRSVPHRRPGRHRRRHALPERQPRVHTSSDDAAAALSLKSLDTIDASNEQSLTVPFCHREVRRVPDTLDTSCNTRTPPPA